MKLSLNKIVLLILLILNLVSCYNISNNPNENLYIKWYNDILKDVHKLSKVNSDSIYSIGIESSENLENYDVFKGNPDLLKIYGFSDLDLLEVASYINANKKLSEKLNLFIESLMVLQKEETIKNGNITTSSEFREFIFSKSSSNLVPQLIKKRVFSRLCYNGVDYCASLVVINIIDYFNYNISGRYKSKYLTEEDELFLHKTKAIMEKFQ